MPLARLCRDEDRPVPLGITTRSERNSLPSLDCSSFTFVHTYPGGSHSLTLCRLLYPLRQIALSNIHRIYWFQPENHQNIHCIFIYRVYLFGTSITPIIRWPILRAFTLFYHLLLIQLSCFVRVSSCHRLALGVHSPLSSLSPAHNRQIRGI
jgi:hypothetical protein